MTKQEMLEILQENRELIENKKFEEFYETITMSDRHYFTDLFLKSRINPLNYMKEVPQYYACNLENLESIEIPNNITDIGSYAFYNCSGLKSIIIPSTVKSIDKETFSWCSSLTDVYYNGTIGDWCKISFGSYSNPMCNTYGKINHYYIKNNNGKHKELKEIEIPNSISEIKKRTFYGFNNVKKVIIPTSVTSIGEMAFYNCDALTDIYYDGTLRDWQKIKIGKTNGILSSIKIHYNSKI